MSEQRMKHLSLWLVVLTLAPPMAGCGSMLANWSVRQADAASHQQEMDRLNAEAQAQDEREAIAAHNAAADARCQSYGAQPGSEVYVQCRMQLDQQQIDAAQADRIAAQEERARRVQIWQAYQQQRAAEAAIQAQQQPAYQMIPPPHRNKPTVCNSQQIGNQVQTVCQ